MEFSALQISESDKGVMVAECPASSAAYKMGIRPKDFIQSVDGRAVRNVGEFLGVAGALAPGKNLKVRLWRALREITLDTAAIGQERGKQ
jgi:S1-C subfamily serine protease